MGSIPSHRFVQRNRDLWQRSYLQTYLERDVRQLGNVSDLASFEMLVSLCATRHSQELNVNELARHCGVSSVTVKKWVGLLESCYVLYLLKPFYNNLGKRVIKSPKLYFCDSGMASYLTRQPSADALVAGNMGGAFMEGFVVMETVKAFYNRGEHPDIYFWRSHDGLEVDLLIQNHQEIIPVEIKLNATPKTEFLKPCQQLYAFARGKINLAPPLLVCTTTEMRTLPGGALALPWNKFGAWLSEALAGSNG